MTGPERRRFPRFPASALGDLSVAILAGPPARLLNASRAGALLLMPARFAPRSSVRVKLTRRGSEPLVVPSRVSWVKVETVSESGQIIYQVAVDFEAAVPEHMIVPVEPAPCGQNDASDVAGEPVRTGEERHSVPDAQAGKALLRPSTHQAEAGVNRMLEAALKEFEQRLSALRSEGENERCRWEVERAEYLRQVQAAAERAAVLQATLETREREHAEELAAQRSRLDATIQELVKTTDDQQMEYQDLLAQLTTVQEEQQRRTDEYEAELARCHEALQRQHADAAAQHRALEARLEASDADRTTMEMRYRALHGELEKLVSTFALAFDESLVAATADRCSFPSRSSSSSLPDDDR